jgi:hypothetical protein
MIGGENWQVAPEEDEAHQDFINGKQNRHGSATPSGSGG